MRRCFCEDAVDSAVELDDLLEETPAHALRYGRPGSAPSAVYERTAAGLETEPRPPTRDFWFVAFRHTAQHREVVSVEVV